MLYCLIISLVALMEEDERSLSPARQTNSSFYDHQRQRKRPSFGSTRNTFKIQTNSQIYSRPRQLSTPSRRDSQVWNESATAMTRDRSPQHAFPQQKRFTSIQQDRAKLLGDVHRLNLRGDLKQGQTFAHSKRATYFPPQINRQNPTPWTYGIKRWLEQTDDPPIEFNTIKHHSNRQARRTCYSSIVRGRTMTKQVRDNQKYYLDHARVHVNYHEKVSAGHPGVGAYSIDNSSGKGKPAFVFGQSFMQVRNLNPAPNMYKPDSQVPRPSTNKGTFDKGNRLDLSKPLNDNPGPSQYSITRFLEKKR